VPAISNVFGMPMAKIAVAAKLERLLLRDVSRRREMRVPGFVFTSRLRRLAVAMHVQQHRPPLSLTRGAHQFSEWTSIMIDSPDLHRQTPSLPGGVFSAIHVRPSVESRDHSEERTEAERHAYRMRLPQKT